MSTEDDEDGIFGAGNYLDVPIPSVANVFSEAVFDPPPGLDKQALMGLDSEDRWGRGLNIATGGPIGSDPEQRCTQTGSLAVPLEKSAPLPFEEMSVRNPNIIPARAVIISDIASSRSTDEAAGIGHSISWANVVQGRPQPRLSDLHLLFVPPSIINGEKVAVCPSEEKEDNLKYWNYTLVGYVLGKRPYFVHLKQAMINQWKPRGSLEFFSRENGLFLFRFGDENEYLRVIENGPWFFEGRLLVLRRWESEASCEQALLNKIPLWIKLPNLPIHWWSQKSISRIASTIGKPLYVDSLTEKRERLTFARICIEVNFEDDLKDFIPYMMRA